VRRRTIAAVDRVTPALASFKPRPDEWTCGEIVRHLVGAERFFVTKVVEEVQDLGGGRVSAWRFLMAMVEHEVHHRSQLDAWLALAGTAPPQIYGYSMEEALAKVGEAR
jgi:hypothetical protein